GEGDRRGDDVQLGADLGILLDEADHVFVAIDAERGRIPGAVIEVALAEDREVANLLHGVGLEACMHERDELTEEHERDAADRDGEERHDGPPPVAEDVAESDLEQHQFLSWLRRSASSPSRMTNVSSPWDMSCGSCVEKTKLAACSSWTFRMSAMISA